MNSLFSDPNLNSYASPESSASGGPEMGAADRLEPTDVYGYEDYRGFLRDRFAELQARNPAFSQRGLARKAGIANPGFFNEVIKGRRRLSPAAALKMAGGLDLSPGETEYFSALVDYAETREPRAKITAGRRMLALKNRRLYQSISDMQSPSEGLREIMRELDREWVLQAAGLDVHSNRPGSLTPEQAAGMAPMSESVLRSILDKLVGIREQGGSAQDNQVIQFNLQVAPRGLKADA